MRKETIYYAFDDTKFDTARECEEYEKRYLINMNHLIAFDEDMNEIAYNGPIDEVEAIADHICKVAEKVHYIGFCDEQIKSKFIKLFGFLDYNTEGMEGNESLTFYYDEYCYVWLPVNDILSDLLSFNTMYNEKFRNPGMMVV